MGTEYFKDLRADANLYTADRELLVPGDTSQIRFVACNNSISPESSRAVHRLIGCGGSICID